MKGVIYKIEINETNIYVGSTTQKLCKRQGNHNVDNNIDFIKCIWVADVEYNSNAELRMVEETYRKKLNGNLNMVKCYITEQDFRESQKEYKKEHYQNNKDKIIEYKKEYRENNKAKIFESNKLYRENNKAKIIEYRENNRDKINAQQRAKRQAKKEMLIKN